MERIKKFYSEKSVALKFGRRYSIEEKQDIYLRETIIGEGQYQYSLMLRSEIMSPRAECIVRHWKYQDKPREIPSNVMTARNAATNSPQRSGGHDSNLPAGASDHASAPFNEPGMRTCPECNGDRITEDTGGEDQPCYTCEGEGEIIEQEYHLYKAEEKADNQSNP